MHISNMHIKQFGQLNTRISKPYIIREATYSLIIKTKSINHICNSEVQDDPEKQTLKKKKFIWQVKSPIKYCILFSKQAVNIYNTHPQLQNKAEVFNRKTYVHPGNEFTKLKGKLLKTTYSHKIIYISILLMYKCKLTLKIRIKQ